MDLKLLRNAVESLMEGFEAPLTTKIEDDTLTVSFEANGLYHTFQHSNGLNYYLIFGPKMERTLEVYEAINTFNSNVIEVKASLSDDDTLVLDIVFGCEDVETIMANLNFALDNIFGENGIDLLVDIIELS